jgi:hypothetical protein
MDTIPLLSWHYEFHYLRFLCSIGVCAHNVMRNLKCLVPTYQELLDLGVKLVSNFRHRTRGLQEEHLTH